MNVAELVVGGISLGMKGHRITQEFHGLLEGMRVLSSLLRDNRLHIAGIGNKVFAQVDGLEGQGTTGVFLFGETENVGTQTNLRLDFLLAVSCSTR